MITKQIQINGFYTRKQNDTFTEIKKSSPYWVVGEKYLLNERGSGDYLHRNARLVAKQTITLDELTNAHSFAAENTTREIMKEILIMRHEQWGMPTHFDVLLFSNDLRTPLS